MKTLKTSMLMAVALIVGVTGVSASANAQEMHHGYTKVVTVKHMTTTHRKGQLFSKLDTNRNGAISRAEFASHYGRSRAEAAVFRRIDSNHSGNLSRAELAAGRAQVHTLHRA